MVVLGEKMGDGREIWSGLVCDPGETTNKLLKCMIELVLFVKRFGCVGDKVNRVSAAVGSPNRVDFAVIFCGHLQLQ